MRKLIIFMLLFLVTPALAQESAPPNNFYEYEHSGVMKGAVPGFAKKPKYFDSKAAEEQIRYLYEVKEVRFIFSLDHCDQVEKVVEKINSSFVSPNEIGHSCGKIVRSRKHFNKNNIALFKEVASIIGNSKFFIHCRYGAHRAVATLTGAWIIKKGLTFDEAFKRTGGKKKHFRSEGQKALLKQLKRFAKKQRKARDE